MIFNHLLNFNRHEKKKPYLCEICGYAATLESTVERHKRVKHAAGKGSMNIQCPKCDYKCSSKQHLKSHDLIVHVEGKNYIFQTEGNINMAVYEIRKPYKSILIF